MEKEWHKTDHWNVEFWPHIAQFHCHSWLQSSQRLLLQLSTFTITPLTGLLMKWVVGEQGLRASNFSQLNLPHALWLSFMGNGPILTLWPAPTQGYSRSKSFLSEGDGLAGYQAGFGWSSARWLVHHCQLRWCLYFTGPKMQKVQTYKHNRLPLAYLLVTHLKWVWGN